ncbi:testis-expressed protein 45 isoform X2 [Tachyglossus aculeatus]|nr:testis-expressed protein 45 isoform X2 [Tachyglossus aculeatus]XP_038596151.1 testis-expressed protein 45 isoform X2 [Tachyglossus aculeatus]
MAMETQRLIPALLPCIDFLKTSHVRLGAESQMPKGVMGRTTVQEHYPPRWGNHKPKPIRPPRCKDIFHWDPKYTGEMTTETYRAYPPWPLQKPEKGQVMNQQETSFQMHVDSKITHFTSTSTMRNSYRVPRHQDSEGKKATDLFGKDNIPSGDREKLGIPLTQNRVAYQPHVTSPVAQAPAQHLGGVSPIRGNNRQYFESVYQKEFPGGWVPPAVLHGKPPTSVVFGDPSDNYSLKMSEQKTAFKEQALPHDRYNKEQAAAQIFHVNLQPGDSHLRFHTTMARDFNYADPGEPVAIDTKDKAHPVSSRRKRESDSREFITTHNHFYAPVDRQNYAPKERLTWNKTQSHVTLGDMELKPQHFTTMNKTDYLPPKVYPEKLDSQLLKASNIKFAWDDDKRHLTTYRQVMLPHGPGKTPQREELQKRISYSHLILPWQDRRFFSTEYDDQFTFKYTGPLVLIKGNLQMSRVPLGSFQDYRYYKKWGSPARAAH